MMLTSGEKLFRWILNRYDRPLTANSWIAEMAREFEMDDLEQYLFRSTALMVLRRLIWNVAWYTNAYCGERLAIVELYEQEYLLGHFGFDRRERRELSKLAFDAFDASLAAIPDALRLRLFREAVDNQERCRLCGKEIDFAGNNRHLSFSLDHIWPWKLGGESEEWNLRVAHRICNERRQDLVEASDTHYEHFHVKEPSTANERDSYWKELNWEFRFASLFRAGFKCEVCRVAIPLHQLEGTLHYSARSRAENLNMFNVQVTCDKHMKLPGAS
jgi:5-methylcytosine-specific restriction endonuclease McrA